jgi:hypothetical protein
VAPDAASIGAKSVTTIARSRRVGTPALQCGATFGIFRSLASNDHLEAGSIKPDRAATLPAHER